MTREEAFKLLSVIKAAYRNSGLEGKSSSEMAQTVNAWAALLEDVPYDLAVQALKMHASVSQFAPAISEIRQRALQLRTPDSMLTAEEVWDRTIKAVRRYGRLKKEQALETIPANVRPYVKRWYMDICNSEELGVIRGQFSKNFELAAKRDKELAQFPPKIQEILLKGAAALALPDGTR